MNKHHPHHHYSYRVTWSHDDGEYVGLCAEFPSLSWLAKTSTAAFKGVQKLVADIVKDMLANDEPVPQPLAEVKYSGKFMVRVTELTHRNLAMEAAEQGISLNRLAAAKLAHPSQRVTHA